MVGSADSMQLLHLLWGPIGVSLQCEVKAKGFEVWRNVAQVKDF